MRMQAAHVPDTVAFATKPALASMMIGRAIAAGVPFAWVAADSVYGVGEVEKTLRRAGRGYVLGVHANHWFGAWNTTPLIAGEAKDIAQSLPAEAWQRLSAGLGTKKGRAVLRLGLLPLADLYAEEFDAPSAGLWTRGLLIRRSVTDGECAYFTTWCPHGTSIGTLSAWKERVGGSRRFRDRQERT